MKNKPCSRLVTKLFVQSVVYITAPVEDVANVIFRDLSQFSKQNISIEKIVLNLSWRKIVGVINLLIVKKIKQYFLEFFFEIKKKFESKFHHHHHPWVNFLCVYICYGILICSVCQAISVNFVIYSSLVFVTRNFIKIKYLIKSSDKKILRES